VGNELEKTLQMLLWMMVYRERNFRMYALAGWPVPFDADIGVSWGARSITPRVLPARRDGIVSAGLVLQVLSTVCASEAALVEQCGSFR